jgi:hypothetical protein
MRVCVCVSNMSSLMVLTRARSWILSAEFTDGVLRCLLEMARCMQAYISKLDIDLLLYDAHMFVPPLTPPQLSLYSSIYLSIYLFLTHPEGIALNTTHWV